MKLKIKKFGIFFVFCPFGECKTYGGRRREEEGVWAGKARRVCLNESLLNFEGVFLFLKFLGGMNLMVVGVGHGLLVGFIYDNAFVGCLLLDFLFKI